MNKIAIVRTGFLTRSNLPNLIDDTKHYNSIGIDTIIYGWDTYTDGRKIEDYIINTLKEVSKQVVLHNYVEYESNKVPCILKKDNREISINELINLPPRTVNQKWGTEQREFPEAKIEFFEYWLNRLKDQYYSVCNGVNQALKLDYDYIIKVRSDISLIDLPIYLTEGIHVPHCFVQGNKDHIVQGDKISMSKYSKILDLIDSTYPIKEKDFSMKNQCAECYLRYFIEETEPKINFNIHNDFVERKNYIIIK